MANINPYMYTLLACLMIINTTNATIAAPAAAPTASESSKTATYTNFIITSCSITTYPSLCYECLSSYASKVKSNPWKLCNTALTVSIEAAKNTSSLAKKLYKSNGLSKIEAAILKDCVDNMSDSIDELKQSVKAMGNMKESSSDVEFQMSNVKTWVSAAITDENTCSDGFDDEENVSEDVKNQIRSSIVNVARITSNALSLVNNLKY